MNTQLLQDIRKNKTKRAYEQEVLDCSHDVIIEFCDEHGLVMPDLNDIKQVSNFMLINVFTPEYNYAYERKRTPNIYQRVEQWALNRMTFGCYTYPICEWLVENDLVHKDFIPTDNSITLNMQLAAERHFQYIARTLLNNVRHDVIYKLQNLSVK